VGQKLDAFVTDERVPPIWRLRAALVSPRLARSHAEAVAALLRHPAAVRDGYFPADGVAEEFADLAQRFLAGNPDLDPLVEAARNLSRLAGSADPHRA
jgi:hypothetical protein